MKRIILAASAVVTMAASCQVNYDKTPSGLVYKIFSGKGGEKVQPGQIVKFNVQFMLTDRNGKKDSLLNPKTYVPNYIKVDTSKSSEYSFLEILPKLSPGDSAVVIISVDSLKRKNALDPTDSVVFVKGSSIKCSLKLLSNFKTENDAVADFHKEEEKENKRETQAVENYMTEKKIKGTKTLSGAYVVIENPGDATIKADSGKVATIKYKGYLQSNGKVFDTNLDSSKGHTDPIKVQVGITRVIPAWQEGLPYFGKGGSGKILVPAFLGYGAQGSPPDIAPYSNIAFDIQVLDVQEGPPASKNQTPGVGQQEKPSNQ